MLCRFILTEWDTFSSDSINQIQEAFIFFTIGLMERYTPKDGVQQLGE